MGFHYDDPVNELTEKIIGAAIEVHRCLGPGMLESTNEVCLDAELKVVDKLAPVHVSQVLSYLRLADLRVGLLFNFNVDVLTRGGVKRVFRGHRSGRVRTD